MVLRHAFSVLGVLWICCCDCLLPSTDTQARAKIRLETGRLECFSSHRPSSYSDIHSHESLHFAHVYSVKPRVLHTDCAFKHELGHADAYAYTHFRQTQSCQDEAWRQSTALICQRSRNRDSVEKSSFLLKTLQLQLWIIYETKMKRINERSNTVGVQKLGRPPGQLCPCLEGEDVPYTSLTVILTSIICMS